MKHIMFEMNLPWKDHDDCSFFPDHKFTLPVLFVVKLRCPSQPFQWFRTPPSSLKVFWPTERYLLSKSKPETNKKMRCESPSKIKWDLTNGPLSKLVRSVGPVGDFLENQQSLNVMFQNLLWRQYGKFFEKTGSSLIKHGKYNCQKDWQSKNKIFLETVQHRFIQ